MSVAWVALAKWYRLNIGSPSTSIGSQRLGIHHSISTIANGPLDRTGDLYTCTAAIRLQQPSVCYWQNWSCVHQSLRELVGWCWHIDENHNFENNFCSAFFSSAVCGSVPDCFGVPVDPSRLTVYARAPFGLWGSFKALFAILAPCWVEYRWCSLARLELIKWRLENMNRSTKAALKRLVTRASGHGLRRAFKLWISKHKPVARNKIQTI